MAAQLMVAESFAVAVEHGYLRFLGEPCETCGSTVKHLANSKCDTCSPPLPCPLYGKRKSVRRPRRSKLAQSYAERWRERHAAKAER